MSLGCISGWMVDWLKALPSQAEDICCTSLDVADLFLHIPVIC